MTITSNLYMFLGQLFLLAKYLRQWFPRLPVYLRMNCITEALMCVQHLRKQKALTDSDFKIVSLHGMRATRFKRSVWPIQAYLKRLIDSPNLIPQT